MPGFGPHQASRRRRNSGGTPTPSPPPTLAALSLAVPTIAENTAAGSVLSPIAGRTAGSTLSLLVDAGGRFALSGANLLAGLTATNFEAATSHGITIRETLAGATNSPRDTALSVAVTNLFEAASLNALTLSSTAYTVGTPASGTVTGATAGSTIVASGLPSGLTVNGAARTWVWDGTGTAGSTTITLTETLADSANSPRASNVGVTVAATGFDADATALFARMSVQPDTTRKNAINALIVALKTGGVWAKLDVLQVYAAHSSQAALLNWKGATSTATLSATAPTFTANRGFATNGTSSFVDTGFAAATHGVQYTQNSASIGYWSRKSGQHTTFLGLGTAVGTAVAPRNVSDQAAYRVNQTSAADIVTTPPSYCGSGLWAASRNGASSVRMYWDGATFGAAGTTASTALSSVTINLGRSNSAFSSAEASMFFAGGNLSAGEHLALFDALRTYFEACGHFPLKTVPGLNGFAIQGVTTNGSSYVWTSSGRTLSNNDNVYTYAYSTTALGSILFTKDVKLDYSTGATQQANGLFHDAATNKLYVGTMNFPVTPPVAAIVEYDVQPNGSLVYNSAHPVGDGNHWTEGCWRWDGYFWVCFHDVHEVHQYDLSWNKVAEHVLPNNPGGTDFWQSITFKGDVMILNLHGNASPTIAPLTMAFRFNGPAASGTAFDLVGSFIPPTNSTCQGLSMDPDGVHMWWAERVDNNADIAANVVRSTLPDLLA